MRIGSLFSGIGGLELGLERAGVGHTVWQVEQDEYCRRVLKRHWPNARRYKDVCDVGIKNLARADVICGGFPCQDISQAGSRVGLAGERSGLWREYARVVRELRPDYVVVENVPALFDRGFGTVLGDLAGLGYDAEWSVVSACSVGAAHMRRRLFVVAYADSQHGRPRLRHSAAPQPNGQIPGDNGFAGARAGWQARLANPSALYGNADGIADGSQRNHAIGNAVVPQVAEVVGRVLLQIHEELTGEAA